MGQVHARALTGIATCHLAKVVDSRLEQAEKLIEPLGASATDSLEPVLADDAIEALIISTPTPSHAAILEQAAKAGKAVFVEKPLAATLAEAERICNIIAETGVPCQVGFQRRYDPAYLEAKHKITEGELGKIEGLRTVGRDPVPPTLEFLQASGGLMVDMGIHDLDSARFFLGEVAEVYCVGGALAYPELAAEGLFDTAVATLKFTNGALGTLEVALRTAYGYDVRAEILGEKGRLHLEMDSRYHLAYYGAWGMNRARPRNFEERFAEAYRLELTAFAENVAAGRPVTPDAADATESLRLALAAQHSLERGQAVKVAEWT
jgi:myo-inositol 2-dehydrogenase/D-chiro-inositol 1-dehydrogenase/scyllo-inositol 2-dehydrogenase (NAD+)